MSRQAKNYTKGKGRKPNQKRSNKRDERNSRNDNRFESVSDTHNDISWYVADQQILNDAARLPYSIPTGVPFSRPCEGQGAAGEDVSIPGILAMRVMPTLGYANHPNDPVNVAAQGIYSFVRHLNSGARNYDPVDLMLYIGAMDSVYSIISFATRLYATICSYTQGNRYLPRLLFEAQSVDFNSFADNMVAFRSQLNQRIAKASQLMVPEIMPIFQRHRWLFANYYIEGETMKDQIYLYRPAGFYYFSLDSDGAGMLDPYILPAMLTLPQLMTYIDNMLNPILEDEDFNIMSGDIYKAYGGKIMTMSLVPDLVTMNFTYDEKVLLQFKNAKPKSVAEVGSAFANNFFQIHQDTGKRYLVVENPSASLIGYRKAGFFFTNVTSSDPLMDRAQARFISSIVSKRTLLTTPHPDVTPEENMINTRGTMAADVSYGTTTGIDTYTYYYGSEWYLDYDVWRIIRTRASGSIVFVHYTAEYAQSYLVDLSSTLAQVMSELASFNDLLNILAKFKYHPEFYVVSCVAQGGAIGSSNINTVDSLFEVDNYSLVDSAVIKGLHDAALLGEFNVPRIALIP